MCFDVTDDSDNPAACVGIPVVADLLGVDVTFTAFLLVTFNILLRHLRSVPMIEGFLGKIR
jgi:hypothetical protein